MWCVVCGGGGSRSKRKGRKGKQEFVFKLQGVGSIGAGLHSRGILQGDTCQVYNLEDPHIVVECDVTGTFRDGRYRFR